MQNQIENPLLDLSVKRRSVRKYGAGKIDARVLDEILKVGLTAPTSFGHKAVRFAVVRDAETIAKIGACKVRGGFQINGADTVIVVMVDTADEKKAEFWIEDGAIASAYLLLAIEQYGLGACWVHIRNRMGQEKTSDEEIRTLLQIPDGMTVLNLIAIGEKGEEKVPYDVSKLHYEAIMNY